MYGELINFLENDKLTVFPTRDNDTLQFAINFLVAHECVCLCVCVRVCTNESDKFIDDNLLMIKKCSVDFYIYFTKLVRKISWDATSFADFFLYCQDRKSAVNVANDKLVHSWVELKIGCSIAKKK
jgi:hypothetical protein